MSTQEGDGEFELVASASWDVVLSRLSYPLKTEAIRAKNKKMSACD